MKDLSVRKNIRLKDHDYSQRGTYFITICVKDGHEILWEDIGASEQSINSVYPRLSDVGNTVDNAIKQISTHFPIVWVDKYVVMPNHIHMLLMIKKSEVTSANRGRPLTAPTISDVINQMKGFVTRQIGYPIWQRSYHDHIVRNKEEYRMIRQYIDENPQKWHEDRYYVERHEDQL